MVCGRRNSWQIIAHGHVVVAENEAGPWDIWLKLCLGTGKHVGLVPLHFAD